MHGRLSCLASGALCLLLLSSCAQTAKSTGDFVTKPFRKTTEQVYGIKTPTDRVAEFRKLAKRAKKQPAAEQQQSIAQLSEEFRRENDGWVRREILRVMAEYPQPEAGIILVEALGDPAAETRGVACLALGKRKDEIAVRELIRMLGSETDDDVRMAAIEALGTSGNKEALAPLAETMASADPAMQTLAQQALVEISGRDYGNNVQAWRELAENGKTDAAEISFAEKLRRTFY